MLGARLLRRCQRFGHSAPPPTSNLNFGSFLRGPDRTREFDVVLLFRFVRISELSDLEQANSNHKNVTTLIPEGHPGNVSGIRFQRLDELIHLEQRDFGGEC